MKIKLLSTWSKYSQLSVSHIQLVTHQQEVWESIKNYQVVFDTALTGDGKTLAALIPAFNERGLGKALFNYPTNELIRDQGKQIEKWKNEFNLDLQIGELTGAKLASYMSADGFNKIETLKNVAEGNNLIATNPDIFTLIHRFYYNRRFGNIAQIAEYWLTYYRYIVFDEFHIFSAPQIANVLDGLAFNRASLGERFAAKFLFLSATPDNILLRVLDKAGITTKVIKGEYDHDLKQSDTHRRILHEVKLDLVSSEQSNGGIENWVFENLEYIQQFFSQYPKSKGLIIANSVFAAKRIIRALENANLGLSIGENTGLTGAKIREDAMNKQLIIATSTVDVGVDFAINFLIYESLDAGTFIQRLGRLGRHDGFTNYQAIALVPDWVKDKFSELYSNETEADRESFFANVREKVYQQPQKFDRYLNRWGCVLSTIRFGLLNQQKNQYQTLIERYSQEATRLVGATPKWCRLNELKEHKIIIKDLETFRGAGQLDIWINDPDTNAVRSINLLRLLAGTDFELISEDEAQEISRNLNEPFYKNNLGLYARITQYLSSYELVDVTFTDYLDRLFLNIAQERKGFFIQSRHREIKKINEQLEYLPLTTCVADPSKYDIKGLRRIYRLPALFELHKVVDLSRKEYPVAFGLDALLLDSLLYWQKTNEIFIAEE
ncbi:type I-D CRISPR-associated helicase Cas3' [Anabaena sp. CCY 9910]|uniref:type I-D CRISPR-associated helicase Cas3' n=1 Tax=Anabaena sp. CCY 9910 TaxID=3103870 RepID=UPI0039E1CE5B